MWVIVKNGVLQQYSPNRITEITQDEEGNELPHDDFEVDIDYETFNEKAWDWTNEIPIDISQTSNYITEQKKQSIQQATLTRNSKYNNITNSVILDQLAITNLGLQLATGTITQTQYDAQKTIYNNRISAKAALFANATDEFYTATGLTKPTITQ